MPQRMFHDLRASNIRWLLAEGLDRTTVMERAGHSQLQTTRRYAMAMDDADTRALDALAAIRPRSR